MSELRRITLLWDELWLGTLAQYSSEVHRRINRFQQEGARDKILEYKNGEDDCTVYSVHCTLYTVHSILYTL